MCLCTVTSVHKLGDKQFFSHALSSSFLYLYLPLMLFNYYWGWGSTVLWPIPSKPHADLLPRDGQLLSLLQCGATNWMFFLYLAAVFLELSFRGFFCSVLFGCVFLFILVFLLGFPLLGIFWMKLDRTLDLNYSAKFECRWLTRWKQSLGRDGWPLLFMKL